MEFPPITIKRAVKLYQEEGPEGFYKEHKRGGRRVLTKEVLKRAQELLDKEKTPAEIAELVDVKEDTLKKAIQRGVFKKKALLPNNSKSEKSSIDNQAPMGMGATNTMGRLLASLGSHL